MWSINKTYNLKKIMLLSVAIVMISVLCSYIAEGDLCYQETANQSHASDGSCSLDYSGLYACSGDWSSVNGCNKTYDGSWSTYGSGTAGYLHINYTKPSGALNSSLWRAKSLDGESNITIPQNIWDQDPLQFYAVSFTVGPSAVNYWYGWNGTNWVRIWGVGSESPNIYEEAMWWNVTSTCSCPESNQSWEIDMNENCIIASDCDIGTGNLTFTNSGNLSIGSSITTANMGIPPAGSIVYINGSGKITITS